MTPDEARRSIHDAEDLRTNLPIDCWRALETVAGMREEWGVTCEEVTGRTTLTHSEWADSTGQLLTHHTARLLAWEKVRAGYPNVRIVRRYVTPTEEA